MGKKKGGKVQGRAKQKQKAQKSSPGGKAPWMKAFAKSFDDNDDSRVMFRGFAQQSGDDGARRGPPQKLRHQAINFVSAGSNTPARTSEEEDEDIAAALAASAEQDEGVDEDKDEDEDEDDEDDIDDSAMQNTIVTDTDVDIAHGTEAMHIHEHTAISDLDGVAETQMDMHVSAANNPPTPPQAEPLSFVIDTVGDPTLSRPQKGKAKVPIRAASPTPSDSSEEVILFHGRNRPTVVNDPVSNGRKAATSQPPARKPTPQQPSYTVVKREETAHVTDDLLAALGVPPGQWAPKPQPALKYVEAAEGFAPAPEGSWWHKSAPRPDLGPSAEEKEALDEAAAAAPRTARVGFAELEEEKGAESTIASLQADWNNARREKKKRAKMEEACAKSHENETVKIQPRRQIVNEAGPSNRRGKRGRKRNNKLLRALEEDESDDSEAAYNDYMENIKAQLDAGTLEGVDDPAGAGPSLVINGEAIADDEVLDASDDVINPSNARSVYDSDSDDTDDDIIGQDIEELEDSMDGMDASDFDSSDLEEELNDNEREMWEDEEDLRQRRIDAMDDEHVARLLAKQIEYGIDDDELVFDDGAFMEEIDAGIGDIDEAKAGLDRLVETSFGQPKSKGRGKGKSSKGFSFPDASALADSIEQYGDNGFDIMDYERPSLRQKPKGRKNKSGLPPELDALSDEDLKDEMFSTWSADRAKKRLKKAEREDLRAQGLLGAAGKKGKADLNQKYLQGMTTSQVHEELRIFLLDEGKTTRAFPPMDRDDRRALHEVANALNLKSKSVGAGKHRAPVLYKTSRTLDYEEATFARIQRASQRGYYKNNSYKPKRATGGPRGMKGGKGAGAAMGAVGLRHGEVVGANAKAIGAESFGHKLMEKMGWQKGAGLGREGEGMIVPVQQVMRTGKTGLG